MKEIIDNFNITLLGQSELYLEQKEAWGKFLETCTKCNTQNWRIEIIRTTCNKCNYPLQIDYCDKKDGGLYRMHLK